MSSLRWFANRNGATKRHATGASRDPCRLQLEMLEERTLLTGFAELAKLTAGDAAFGDHFGTSVAVSGDTVVVGANLDDDGGTSSGSAYVFTGSGTSWTQGAKLTAGDAAFGDLFGGSVSVSGNTVVVGARWDDDGGKDSGSAYVFTRSGTSWTQEAKLTAGDAAESDQFGSVAVSGDTVVVGAIGGDDAGSFSGSVYVFGPTNVAPEALDDAFTMDEDTGPVVFDVAANDTDPDDNLDPTTATATSGPSNGALTNNGDGTFSYAPDLNFNGTDTFTYEMCDTSGACDTATVTITVNSVIDALIDVKPGSGPNSINLKSKGRLPIAILSTQTANGELDNFDATLLDTSTIELNGVGVDPVHVAFEDVDGDGDLDLILHFLTQEIKKEGILDADSVDLVLSAEFAGGDALGPDLIGGDSVRIVPLKK